MQKEVVSCEVEDVSSRPLISPEGYGGYALVFGLLGKMLYSNPECDLVSKLASQHVFDELPLDIENTNAVAGQKLLSSWFERFEKGCGHEVVDDVRCDYVPLFVNGKFGASAPPWESIYVNSSPAFFQCSTMAVRMWYRRYSLMAENQDHEPDDHIGLELSFLGYLCSVVSGMTALPMVNGVECSVLSVEHDTVEFARTHVFTWATHWCDIVADSASTDYYRGLALLAKGMIESFAADLGEKIHPCVFR